MFQGIKKFWAMGLGFMLGVGLLLAAVPADATLDGISGQVQGQSQSSNVGLESTSSIRFSSGFNANQMTELRKVLGLITSTLWRADDIGLQNILHGPVSGQALDSWLAERIHILLDPAQPTSGDVLEFSGEPAGRKSLLPTGDVIKAIPLLARLRASSEDELGVVASNVGILLYNQSKKDGRDLQFRVQGVGLVPVQSPRAGIVQLSTPFFAHYSISSYGDDLSGVDAIMRLANLFHEARHSDGHGETRGFLHVICPPGNAYQGKIVCDAESNGPYAVAATILQSAEKACDRCTFGQNLTLDVLINDLNDRVIPSSSHPVIWDETPE